MASKKLPSVKLDSLLVGDTIQSGIVLVRGLRVMLSHDLAALYGVETKVLVQTIKRNVERFPIDFMFQITDQEVRILKSQFVTSSWGGIRKSWYRKLRYQLKTQYNGKSKQRIDYT